MGKYFVHDTPLAELERQMMMAPNFSSRGYGRAIFCRYRPTAADVDCRNCLEHRRHGCRSLTCLYLSERLEAGVVTLDELIAEAIRPWKHLPLKQRSISVNRGYRPVRAGGYADRECGNMMLQAVITNFSDWEQVGREHRTNVSGGAIPAEEYNALDGKQEALKLILNESGTVTPYGVVYDNGMKLEPLYDKLNIPNQFIPLFLFADGMISS